MKKHKVATRRSPKRHGSKAKGKKQVFRTRNWAQYTESLVSRGSLTVWFDSRLISNWGEREVNGRRGASKIYSDGVIMSALTLKAIYHQPLRGTEGLLRSVLQLMGLEHLPVPDYSTLCRRQRSLNVPLADMASRGAIHLVVDSTGCKVYGEGEWKVRRHGYGKRRTWRTLHLGIDEGSREIKAAMLTSNSMSDSEALPELLEQVGESIYQLSGDGGYDKRRCYDALNKRQEDQGSELRVAIPPRHCARIWKHGNAHGERLARDENLRRIRKVGRSQWKQEIGYHRRSLAETTMYRLKTQFGERISARTFENQATEVFIRCMLLNKMNQMGRPDSYLLEAP